MKRFIYDAGANEKSGGTGGDKQEKQPLKPALQKPTEKHGKTEDVVVLRPGQVYIVPLDDQGNEISGAWFITNQAAQAKHYNDPKKFVTKKKAF